mmetsp:Transcript_23665/g.47780  ORF Transcript_23665/g.47780 Transcript_23665/m.47780 type:complete len:235 (+) Transcript_23665:151-855(+)|eukprot:CAMPEP_0181311822 /NCGR_PEP_ID=MMETSP1101-20121128/13359_1 /TAXON_ID=46948 /ORGANISM="Rhodomonas abbreviata, Strain Caron Lab Isolate" /LENGTH=234 /DNA_ID=CAMNT_0023418613 /DNA_START=150 /DNA_END=854 /DNA_ORIENTATION=-
MGLVAYLLCFGIGGIVGGIFKPCPLKPVPAEEMSRLFPLAAEIANRYEVFTHQDLVDVYSFFATTTSAVESGLSPSASMRAFTSATWDVLDQYLSTKSHQNRMCDEKRWELSPQDLAIVGDAIRRVDRIRWRCFLPSDESFDSDVMVKIEQRLQDCEWKHETTKYYVHELLVNKIYVMLAAPHLSFGGERVGDVVVFDENKHEVVNGRCSRCVVLLPSLLSFSGNVAVKAAVMP